MALPIHRYLAPLWPVPGWILPFIFVERSRLSLHSTHLWKPFEPIKHARWSLRVLSTYFTQRIYKVSVFVNPCIIVSFIKKNPTRCNNVSKFYYSIFKWSSTCFGRGWPPATRPTTFHVWKTRGCSEVLGSWWWAVCRPKHVEPHINME